MPKAKMILMGIVEDERGSRQPKTTGELGDLLPTAQADDRVEASSEAEPPAEYVPMSEWIGDFESRAESTRP